MPRHDLRPDRRAACCRAQQDQLGHRGHRDDPLFEVRRQMRRGVETLTATNGAKLEAAPATSPAP